MGSIFNLEAEYIALMNDIEEADGVLDEDMEQRLAINIDNFENKVRQYRYLMLNLEADITMGQDEMGRIAKLIGTKSNIIKRLKDTVRDSLQLYGDTGKSGNKVLDLGDMKMYTRKNEIVIIDDEGKFIFNNFDYVKATIGNKFDKEQLTKIAEFATSLLGEETEIKTTYSIDKRLIKSELKGKVEIEGARLERNDSVIFK